ncbi:hypothetical protein CICLE_v10017377mg [Citrus x clementina]|uniref:Uncharacterized protein n=1 Tax=Citrus clementina TaxID=85681 RepID=V4U3A8_CITCL|nr:hypothetical protein CICLE_v10017377mg [Citrus x clementina]
MYSASIKFNLNAVGIVLTNRTYKWELLYGFCQLYVFVLSMRNGDLIDKLRCFLVYIACIYNHLQLCHRLQFAPV